jgi:hypothetical protein
MLICQEQEGGSRSILDGLWRIAQLSQDAVESLDGRIEEENLDGMADAVEDAVMFPIGVRIGFKASNVGG